MPLELNESEFIQVQVETRVLGGQNVTTKGRLRTVVKRQWRGKGSRYQREECEELHDRESSWRTWWIVGKDASLATTGPARMPYLAVVALTSAPRMLPSQPLGSLTPRLDSHCDD